MSEAASNDVTESSLALLKGQRSHVLFVLSNPNNESGRSAFIEWYRRHYRHRVLLQPGVLSAQHYEQDEADVTRGKYPRLPFRYLGIFELSLDGAEEAADIIDSIASLHREHPVAQAPATWLYYPAVEKVGRAAPIRPSMLTIAFANGVPGQEAEFREWYATRHIRHALNLPLLTSGQSFERTQFQKPGAMEVKFSIIAIYEQVGSTEALIESFNSIDRQLLRFPTMDKTRFTECSYRSL